MEFFEDNFLDFDFGTLETNEKETNIFSSENSSQRDEKRMEDLIFNNQSSFS